MISQVITVALYTAASVIAVTVFVLFVECMVAVVAGSRSRDFSVATRPRIAVLVPAHNEQAVIARTCQSISTQLSDTDRLIVVADNCDDDTGVLASSAGATVLERRDDERRGKGFALAFGVDHLRNDPPEVVVLMDADTIPDRDAISAISRQAAVTSRPAQAVYLLDPPPEPSIHDLISYLAFTVKNLVRPAGLAWFGMPCPITGSGVALPWKAISSVKLGSGNIVEDMQLGVDLAIAGYPPLLCGRALLRGVLPSHRRAALQQRTRWEHGHIQTLLSQVPRLMAHTLLQLRLALLVMALDLSIPPLSLLCLGWFAATICAASSAHFGVADWGPASILLVSGLMLFVAVVGAWARYARDRITVASLIAFPLYICGKVPLYLAYFLYRQRTWVRTERDPNILSAEPSRSSPHFERDARTHRETSHKPGVGER